MNSSCGFLGWFQMLLLADRVGFAHPALNFCVELFYGIYTELVAVEAG